MAKRERYRVGVIGAGAIAQECHIPGYQRNEHAHVVAVADPSTERHEEVIAHFGNLNTYTDYRKMLDLEDLDVVSVCTPNKFHAENAIAALNRGCHVLCEKPIATTLREADRMIETARKTKRKLMIGFTHRLFSGTQKSRDLLDQNAIGRPFMIRVRFAHGGPYPGWAKNSWFYKKDLAAGGAMLDMGIHAIDLCHWLIGPVISVSGRAVTLFKKIEVDDNALMLLEFKNRALGYIEVGWTSKPGFSGFEIYGSEGSLTCHYLRGLELCGGKSSAGRDSVVKWTMLDKSPTKGGWQVEIDHWMNVVRGKERLTMTGKAGRNALAVALAAYKSSETGRRVRVG